MDRNTEDDKSERLNTFTQIRA